MSQQQTDFAAVMARNSDLELAEVLSRPDDYVPEALEAARVELLKRNTTVESLVKQREEAIRTEISYDNFRHASLKKQAIWLGASIPALGALTAAVMEFLEPTSSLAHFAETMMGIGISVAGMGWVLFNLKMFSPPASLSSITARSSLEELRQNQSRSEVIRSTIFLPVSVLSGGIVLVLISVLLRSFK